MEIGLAAGPIDVPDICCEYLLDDEIILLVGPTHPCAGSPVPISLRNEVLISREEGSATRQAVETFLEKERLEPKKTIVLGDTEAIKRAVMAGLGVSFLSESTVHTELKHRLLFAVDSPQHSFSRQLFALYPKGGILSPAAHAFLSKIRQFITKAGMAE